MGRLLQPGIVHHLVRRSYGGKEVFIDELDYRYTLNQMFKLVATHRVRLHAWCLLPDQIRMLASFDGPEDDLSRLMKALVCRKTLHYNRRYNHAGSPWENRFGFSPVEPGQWVLACMRYIESLSAMKGLASCAFRWDWSSYRMRLGYAPEYQLNDPREYRDLGDTPRERIDTYREYLRFGADEREQNAIENAAIHRRVTGSYEFAREVEQWTGVYAPNRKPGRPPKSESPISFAGPGSFG